MNTHAGSASTSSGNNRRRLVLPWAYLKRAVERSITYSAKDMVVIGLVGIIGFPAYWLVWQFVYPQSYENLYARLIGSALCVPLALFPRWPERWKRLLPLIWLSAILYCLPTVFTYMLLQDFSHAISNDAPFSFVWPMSNVIALVMMVLLLSSGWLSAILYVTGSLLGWAGFLITGPEGQAALVLNEYVSWLPVFLFVLVGVSAYNHRNEMVQQQMLQAVASVGGHIAHELRTPLLSIRASTHGIGNFLGILIETYNKARAAGMDVAPIRANQMANLERTLDRIDGEITYSNAIIDMILMNASSGSLDSSEFKVLSMRQCVDSALARYPCTAEQRQLIVFDAHSPDFDFKGSEVLMSHLLFNLLKNALYYVAEAGKGTVEITTSPGDKENILRFKDYGTGIPSQSLPLVFDQFYSNQAKGRGSGIGLSFCRLVMTAFKGTIKCDSEYGRYTEFVMTFPPVIEDV